jgi:phosphoribosylpyrophosphate synthetase
MAGVGEWRLRIFDSHLDRFADIFQADVAHERSGKQPGFAENLETVADAEDESASVGELTNGFHDRRKLRDSASAEVIAKGKASRNDDGIAVLQVVRVVPEKSYGLLSDMLDRPESIVVAVGTGENYDAKFHGASC